MVGRRVEDIVLYDGSFNELNSRDRKKKYSFAEHYSTYVHIQVSGLLVKDFIATFPDQAKEFIFKMGYDGLVNKKTHFSRSEISGHVTIDGYIEGTPIKLVNKRGRK